MKVVLAERAQDVLGTVSKYVFGVRNALERDLCWSRTALAACPGRRLGTFGNGGFSLPENLLQAVLSLLDQIESLRGNAG